MGTVNTGTPLYISHTVGTSAVVGQGTKPNLWALVSFDDASEPTPNWVDVSADVRDYRTSRGRDSELSEHDAGTATVTFDNRQSEYDPSYVATVRPMNRIWLREQFNGVTNDIFKGYVESWDQQWPAPGFSDALSIASCTDEFKVLNLAKLPVMDPPRDTYIDCVASDNPTAFYDMNDNPLTLIAAGNLAIGATGSRFRPTREEFEAPIPGPGTTFAYYPTGGTLTSQAALIRGEKGIGGVRGSLFLNGAGFFGLVTTEGGMGDVGGLSSFTIETWFQFGANPSGADRFIVQGPTPGGNATFELKLLTTGAVRLTCRNSSGTTNSATTAVLTPGPNQIYHIVGVYTGLAISVYLNGVSAASTGHSGAFAAFAPDEPTFLGPNESGSNWVYDSLAFYRYALSESRITAHYTAGTARGDTATSPALRMIKVLDAVANQAPRSFRSSLRAPLPIFYRGQDPLSEIRYAVSADNVDAMFFVAADGTLTFLDADHRSVSPWNTTQATFSDDGTNLPYEDLDVDYSDAFLFNEWIVTREDSGTSQTSSDSTSISKYGRRTKPLSVPIADDSDASDIAAAMLAKYKDPLLRATSLVLNTADLNVLDAVFQLELGDRIRVIKILPGPAGTFDQTLYIQKIEVEASNDQGPWRVRLGVSPV